MDVEKAAAAAVEQGARIEGGKRYAKALAGHRALCVSIAADLVVSFVGRPVEMDGCDNRRNVFKRLRLGEQLWSRQYVQLQLP